MSRITLKNKNLSKVNDVASRNKESKSCIRDAKDAKLQSQEVDPKNDFQMVAEDLRSPHIRKIIREKITPEERKALKQAKKQHKQAA